MAGKTERFIIGSANLPRTFPWTQTAIQMLITRVYDLPGWAVGVMWTLIALLWIAKIGEYFTETDYEVNLKRLVERVDAATGRFR